MASREERKENRQRIKEIYDVAKKYNVSELISESRNPTNPSQGEYDEELDASGIRLALEELGPAYVKLGQLLCTRPDLVGNDIAEELTKLRDNTPVTPFEEIKEVIETELGQPLDEVYSEFEEEPLGSASIGQVYKATLKENGEKVAVKVQKPGSYEIVAADVRIMVNLAEKADKYITKTRTFNLPAIIKEFERSIFKELDYMEEVMNIQKITKNFEGYDYVKYPKVYPKLCTNRLINMELVEGYNVTELYDNEIDGISGKKIADDIVESYFKQLMLDGFFHADPHPGNMVVDKNEKKLCYLDLGMMGILNETFRADLAQLLLLLLGGNANSLVKQLLYMKIISPEQDTDELRMDIEDLVNRYIGADLDQMDGVLEKLINTMIKHGVTLPREFVMIGRGVALIEDIGYNLDKDFNIGEALQRFSKKLVVDKFNPINVAKGSYDYLLDVEHLMKVLPDRINSTLTKIEKGEIKVNLELDGLTELKNQISVSLIISALLIGSSLAILADKGPKMWDISVIGLWGFLISGILGLYVILKYIVFDK
ncbi:MAG: AarF/ABC1/UbiB kinase family protein [Methanobrevibacter sp.]|nr:AarF/ABC1/UbiB kinase family protein [Methanobrevibacter sp.]